MLQQDSTFSMKSQQSMQITSMLQQEPPFTIMLDSATIDADN